VSEEVIRGIHSILRRIIRGDTSWCCVSAGGRFAARLDCGDFIVAGAHDGRVEFLAGFNAVNRADRARPVRANAAVAAALTAACVSNMKVFMFSGVRYCSSCGANLRSYYGRDGGLLRDDAYVAELYAPVGPGA